MVAALKRWGKGKKTIAWLNHVNIVKLKLILEGGSPCSQSFGVRDVEDLKIDALNCSGIQPNKFTAWSP